MDLLIYLEESEVKILSEVGLNRMSKESREIVSKNHILKESKLVIAVGIIEYQTSSPSKWNPADLLHIIVLLPILLLGLVAWVKWFHRGCYIAAKEAT